MGPKTNVAGFGKIPLKWVGILVIFTTTFVSYMPALRGDFIWDDDRHVSQNPTLSDLNGLRRIWFRWGATPQYYPMTHTSFWIEHQIWGLNTTGYHITNVMLHVVNAILLWQLLSFLGVPGAWMAGAVFALHPVNVESVAWITERKNVLATCFALLSMIAYLKPSKRGYWWSLALFACALLSKSVTASVPAVLLLLIWWKQGRITRRDWKMLAPFFLIGMGMGLMTAWMERNYVGASGPDWNFTFADRILIAGRVVCFYVLKDFWPSGLTFSYPKWVIDAHDWRQWLYPVGVVAGLVVLVLNRKRWGRGPAAAAMIFCGTLFPALGFFNTFPMLYSFVADHFQYLSMSALIAGVVAGASIAIRSTPIRAGLSLVLICTLTLLTWRQAHIYAGPEALWEDTVAKNPDSWMACNNLGVTLSFAADADRAAGRIEEANRKLLRAIDLFKQTETLRPQHELVRTNLADVLAKLHRNDAALAIYRAETLKPSDNPDLHRKIAYLLEDMGLPDQAVAEYEASLKKFPNASFLHLELGLLLGRMNKPADAIVHLERYVAANQRDINAIITLGYAYEQSNRPNDAKAEFSRALEIDPESLKAQQAMASVQNPVKP